MEMINQNKILALLNDEYKCSLVGIAQGKIIVVKSAIDSKKLKALIDFCDPLNYTVHFGYAGMEGLIIVPS